MARWSSGLAGYETNDIVTGRVSLNSVDSIASSPAPCAMSLYSGNVHGALGRLRRIEHRKSSNLEGGA